MKNCKTFYEAHTARHLKEIIQLRFVKRVSFFKQN